MRQSALRRSPRNGTLRSGTANLDQNRVDRNWVDQTRSDQSRGDQSRGDQSWVDQQLIDQHRHRVRSGKPEAKAGQSAAKPTIHRRVFDETVAPLEHPTSVAGSLGVAGRTRSDMLRQLPLDNDDTLRARSRMGGPPLPSTVTDLAGFFSILARHWLSIVLLTLLGLCAGIAYLALVPPTFTASTTLLIDPRSKKVVNDELPQAGGGPDLGLLESQVAIIRSDAVLGRVVDKLKLTSDPDFVSSGQGLGAKMRTALGIPNRRPDARTQAIATLADIVTVRRAQKTYVVEIDAASSEPVRAAELASAVAGAYISDQTTAKSDDAKRANDLIEGRLGELRQQVRAAETKIDEFRKQNSILTSEGGTVGEQQLTRLNTELISARSQASEARARADEVTLASRSGNFDTITDPAKTSLVQRLREQLAQVSRREAALSAQLLPRHPVVLDIRSQVTEIRSQINAELRRLALTAKSELAVADARERELTKALERTKSEVGRNNTAQIRQRELEGELNASRELLRVFLARSKETEEQQKISTPDARVISPPSIPSRPTKPIPALVLALGLIGGLAAGITRALLGDMFDRRVRTPAAASAITGLATLAALPMVGAGAFRPPRRRRLIGGRLSEPAPSLVERSPLAGIALAASGEAGEAGQDFRRAIVIVLNRVRRRSLSQPPHTVLFTGTSFDAGTTTTAFAIAYAAAALGDRVLLVDASSADPGLTNALDCPIPSDRVVALDRADDLASIISHDRRSGLDVLPIAAADLRTLAANQRARLMRGLEALSADYDLVIIDAGPGLEDASAHIVLPVCNEVILVARAGTTDVRALSSLAQHMDVARDRISGVVLNRA